MYVKGWIITTPCPEADISASLQFCHSFFFNFTLYLHANLSVTRNPVLCLLLWYFLPGLPKPAISFIYNLFALLLFCLFFSAAKWRDFALGGLFLVFCFCLGRLFCPSFFCLLLAYNLGLLSFLCGYYRFYGSNFFLRLWRQD